MSSKFTRVVEDCKRDNKNPPDSVIGCLIGTMKSLQTDIRDVYEFPYRMNTSGKDLLDVAYIDDEQDYDRDDPDFVPTFEKCKNLALEVHRKQGWQVVGWFSYSSKATRSAEDKERDMRINNQLKELLGVPRLLFLRLCVETEKDTEELPIEAFEENLGSFVKVNFKVHADRAEGVAMGHIEKMQAPDDGVPPLVGHLCEMKTALRKLQDRISVIRGFLMESKIKLSQGEDVDVALLRKTAAVMNQIPGLSSGQFNESFLKEHNNAKVVTYLAVATKIAASLGVVLDKSSSISQSDSTGIRGGDMGYFGADF